jgi:hypothetical protein
MFPYAVEKLVDQTTYAVAEIGHAAKAARDYYERKLRDLESDKANTPKCTCGVKTPQAEYHSHDCPVRVAII